MTKDIKYIVVPDVHGRDFYESIMNTFIENSDAHMIFLGDYVDPYPREKITPNKALKKFKAIIKFKKQHPDRVTLLIGNHDFHYIDGSRRGVRMDYYNKDELCRLFIKNMDLFEYVKCVRIGNKNFVFSHAGFNLAWFDAHYEMLGVCDVDHYDRSLIEKKFNYRFISKIDFKELAKERLNMNTYGEVGSSRGGWCSHPSFIWSDLTDILVSNDKRLANCIQIFGHTQLSGSKPVRFDNCFCLDCRRVFYINSKGTVLDDNYHVIKRNGEEYKKAYMEYIKKMSMFFL
jgi:predicted phosphodiesterase